MGSLAEAAQVSLLQMGSAVQTEPLEVEEDKGLSAEYVFNNEDLQAVLEVMKMQGREDEAARAAQPAVIERQEIRVIEERRSAAGSSPGRRSLAMRSPGRASPLTSLFDNLPLILDPAEMDRKINYLQS